MSTARDPSVCIPVSVPYSMLMQIEALAPPGRRARSALVQAALKDYLAKIEREHADPALQQAGS